MNREKRFGELRADVRVLTVENRDWLVTCLLEVQQDLRRLDITAAESHLQEILEAVAED